MKAQNRRGMAVFDMDGTLVRLESSWQLIHKAMGTLREARDNMERYRRGEISYDEWAELDVACWLGKDFSPALRALSKIEPVDDLREALELLRERGLLVGVVSSGLDLVLKRVEKLFEFDFSVTNELILEGSRVVGWRVNVPFNAKGGIVKRLASKLGIPLDRVAVIGDAENDLEMFRIPVGLRVAFNPSSEALEREADVVIRSNSLLDVARVVIEWLDGLRT